jgi:hypothetical protein
VSPARQKVHTPKAASASASASFPGLPISQPDETPRKPQAVVFKLHETKRLNGSVVSCCGLGPCLPVSLERGQDDKIPEKKPNALESTDGC